MKKRTTAGFEGPDRLNVIVEGSKIIGDIITESNIRIDGEVKGNVISSAKVVIGQSGILNGDLTCMDADLEGQVFGNTKIDGLLSLRDTARIKGNITTSRFHVEEGAVFSGSCSMSNASGSMPSAGIPKMEEQEGLIY